MYPLQQYPSGICYLLWYTTCKLRRVCIQALSISCVYIPFYDQEGGTIRNDDETIMSRAYDQFPAITRLSREIRVNDFESCNLFVHGISEFVHKS
ncbi:unnamed protein product [Fusarium graminearum]|uniref:Chromosome 1, complete genome n=1 Tax=Gibberella zeae (strain ATCC MYA-4620 / CBS 123657 / FGSC 9075 / NRRL 31084 / PH-1) TaxID=229533 RepID=A0A098D329_GIBZE|nr:unnamed protein product [Fusarium graminearum]CEF73348.1 unnamed protein product [Fusarium graminearum]